jgi:hypothetical protein
MENIMDKSKGQKIVAALYLVTAHLSDTDPLKVAVRTEALALVRTESVSLALVRDRVEMVLGGAVLAGLISEKNASIILLEVRHFVASVIDGHADVRALFAAPSHAPTLSDTPTKKLPSFSASVASLHSTLSDTKPLKTTEAKSDRKQAILSFINDRKSAGIKDIAAIFPDLSEKTIQRELGALVSEGKMTKRGSKRWSVYMAVSI